MKTLANVTAQAVVALLNAIKDIIKMQGTQQHPTATATPVSPKQPKIELRKDCPVTISL